MNTRECLAAFLGMAAVSLGHASANRPAVLTDGVALPGAVQDNEALLAEVVDLSMRPVSYSLNAISGPEVDGLPSWSIRNCRSTLCKDGRAALANVQFAVRYETPLAALGGLKSAPSTDKAEAHPASTLDIGLMLLVGAGLLGSQLRRKQKALRHSSLMAV